MKSKLSKKNSNRLRYKIWLSCIGIIVILVVITLIVFDLIDNKSLQAGDIPEEWKEYELTGKENKIRAALISLMGSPTGEFIYVYESGCDACEEMDSIIFPLAEQQNITVSRFNASQNKDLLPLLDLDNISLPATIYYSRGYKIGWIGSNEEDQYYKDFFDHFHHHYEKHPEGEPDYQEIENMKQEGDHIHPNSQ